MLFVWDKTVISGTYLQEILDYDRLQKTEKKLTNSKTEALSRTPKKVVQGLFSRKKYIAYVQLIRYEHLNRSDKET